MKNDIVASYTYIDLFSKDEIKSEVKIDVVLFLIFEILQNYLHFQF